MKNDNWTGEYHFENPPWTEWIKPDKWRKKDGKPIMVGVDCAGMGTPLEALAYLTENMKVEVASELDDDTRAVLTRRFEIENPYAEAASKPMERLRAVDLYVAGFPCQPYSTAGKKLGENDRFNRHAVLEHILNYVEKSRPKMFILENVSGLISQNEGRLFDYIMIRLEGIKDETGQPIYHCRYSLLNAREFCLPQNRLRLFIVGIAKRSGEAPRLVKPGVCSPEYNDVESYLDSTTFGHRRKSKNWGKKWDRIQTGYG